MTAMTMREVAEVVHPLIHGIIENGMKLVKYHEGSSAYKDHLLEYPPTSECSIAARAHLLIMFRTIGVVTPRQSGTIYYVYRNAEEDDLVVTVDDNGADVLVNDPSEMEFNPTSRLIRRKNVFTEDELLRIDPTSLPKFKRVWLLSATLSKIDRWKLYNHLAPLLTPEAVVVRIN